VYFERDRDGSYSRIAAAGALSHEESRQRIRDRALSLSD
jgi:hypothetical protein